MKKTRIFLMALALVAMLTVAVSAENVMDRFAEPISGIWDITETRITSTMAPGDMMVISDIEVTGDETFVFSADTVLTESVEANTGGIGLMIVTGDVYNPIGTGCIIQRSTYAGGDGQTELWTLNIPDYGFNANDKTFKYAVGDKIHYDLVYDGEKMFYSFVNGEFYLACECDAFAGGTLALLAWAGTGYYENIEFSNDISAFIGTAEAKQQEKLDAAAAAAKAAKDAALQAKIDSGMALNVVGVPADAENIMDEINEPISGIWDLTDTRATSTIASGDCMVISEKFVAADEAFVWSMDAVLTETAGGTGGVGPLLITGDVYNPIGTGCVVIRTDYSDSRTSFWTLNTATINFSSWVALEDKMEVNEVMHYDVVYDGNYTFYGYVNGELIHIVDATGFEGAYLGYLCWSGTGYIENVTFSNDISHFVAKDEPVVEEPVVEEPVVEEPVVEEPVVEEPVVEEPVVEEPVVEEPVVEEPVVEEPVVEAPVVEAPKTADAIVVLAAASIISAGAAIVSKKRR